MKTRSGKYQIFEDRENKRRLVLDRKTIAETGFIPQGLMFLSDSAQFEILKTDTVMKESKNGEVPVLRATGLIQKGDTENANTRFYDTRSVLKPAIESIQKDVADRAVLGEYDHPYDAKIHLDRVSHLMSNVWMENNKVYGEIEVLHRLPLGACLRGLFEHKVRVGISSRGVGDMEIAEHKGREVYRVLPGFQFVTWDVVAEPSVNGAILGIKEGLERRIKPLQKNRKAFSPEVYQNRLVEEINKYFNLK